MVKFTTNFVRNNGDIIFTRTDKSNSGSNKTSYVQRIEELLEDAETYLVITKNPTLSIEKNLNDIFKNWSHHRGRFISKKEFLYLRSSDSLLPKASPRYIK